MLNNTPVILFPLTLTKRSLQAPYVIEGANRDGIAYMNPTRPNREREGQFLVRAGNAHYPLMEAVIRSQAVLTRWMMSDGMTTITALKALHDILNDKALVEVVKAAGGAA